MRNQLYKKIGRRYQPVNDPGVLDGLEEGTWIVQVKPGSKSIKYLVEKDFTKVDSALLEFQDVLVDAIYQESTLRPLNIKLSDKEKKGWESYKKIVGDSARTMFGYQSCYDIAAKAIQKFKSLVNQDAKF